MSLRSLALLASLSLVACNNVDPLVGSYSFTFTGTETQTAPSSATSTSTGSGTMAVTEAKTDNAFVITLAPGDSTGCTLRATKSTTQPLQADLDGAQTCSLRFGDGTVVSASFSGGSFKVDQATMNEASLTLSYAFSGSRLLLGGFSGTGMRTYTGTRL